MINITGRGIITVGDDCRIMSPYFVLSRQNTIGKFLLKEKKYINDFLPIKNIHQLYINESCPSVFEKLEDLPEPYLGEVVFYTW